MLKEDIVHAEPSEHIKYMGELKERYTNISLSKRGFPSEPKWYPLCKEYSYLYNYPKDIKPDWLDLIEECKAMLIADGIEI